MKDKDQQSEEFEREMSKFEIDLPPYQDEPAPHYYNRDEPVSTNYLNIELSKDLNAEALTKAITEVMERTETRLKESLRKQLVPYAEMAVESSASGDEDEESEADKRLRLMIREEVHRALYPDAALANPHKHMRVEMTTEQGDKWRGVLYAVDEGE